MNETRAGINFDRLTKRRAELLSTLQHLHKERAEVERNTDWLDQAAYESRGALLDCLNSWYETEVSQIDRAASGILQSLSVDSRSAQGSISSRRDRCYSLEPSQRLIPRRMFPE